VSKAPNPQAVDAILKAATRTMPNSLGTWAIHLADFIDAPADLLADGAVKRAKAKDTSPPVEFLSYVSRLESLAVIVTAFIGLYPEHDTKAGRAAIGRIHRAASTITGNLPGIEATARLMRREPLDHLIGTLKQDTAGTADALRELAAIADGYDAERGMPDPPAAMLTEGSTFAEAVERIRAAKPTTATYVTFQQAADEVKKTKNTITGWVTRYPERFKRNDKGNVLLSDVVAFDREQVHKSELQARKQLDSDEEPDAATIKQVEAAKKKAARKKCRK
jgi:hypothetical protein